MNKIKVLISALWMVLVFSLANNSYAQSFQQDKFIIGTFNDPEMGISQAEIDNFLININVATFNTKKAAYITKLENVKNAHFNLLTGTNRSSTYNGAVILYNLEILSTTPSLSGLKTLIYYPGMTTTSSPGIATGPHTSLGGWTTETVFKGWFYEPTATTYFPKYCPGGLGSNAIYGYNLFDEPKLISKDSIHAWGNYINNLAPTKLVYTNFGGGAYWGDLSTCKGRTGFDTHMSSYLDSSYSFTPSVVGMDYYPFEETYCNDDPADAGSIKIKNRILENYFYGLSATKKLSRNKPFWCYPLSTEHTYSPDYNTWISGFYDNTGCPTTELNYTMPNCSGTTNLHYISPSYSHLMFMDFCPIVYGAKGLIYFSYELPTASGTTWSNAIVDSNGDTLTQRYQDVKNINHYIEKLVGPVVMSSTWLGAYHKSNKPTNEASLISGGVLANELLSDSSNKIIANVNDSNILFGVFVTDSLNGSDETTYTQYHLLVVNKSLTPTAGNVEIKLKNVPGQGIRWGDISVAPKIGTPSTLSPSSAGQPYNGSTSYTIVSSSLDTSSYSTTFTIDTLKGGEARLVELKYYPLGSNGKTNSGLPRFTTIYPNPVSSILNIEYENPGAPSPLILIWLTDELGNTITTFSTDNSDGTHSISYDTSSLPNGMYYVKMYQSYSSPNSDFRRIFIQH